MFKKYLLSSVCFAPADEKGNEKTDVQKQRDSIEVTTGKATEQDEETEVNGEQEKEDGKEETEETEDETKSEEKEDDDAKELELKSQKKSERLERKLAREAEKRRDAEKELATLKSKMVATEGDVLTEEDVERRSEIKATEKQIQREFEKAVNKLNTDAIKADKDFSKKINDLAEDIGAIPGQMIGILDDIDNGGAVLAHLASNPDEAEDIWELKNNLPKLSLALLKVSEKIKIKPRKEISKVPEPPDTLGGSQKKANVNIYDKNYKGSDKDWITARQKDVNEARKNGRYNLR